MEQTKSPALLPFILSLVSLVLIFALAVWPFVGLAFGVAALVLAVNARKVEQSGMCTAAFIISIICVCIGAIEMIAWIACVGFATSVAGGVMNLVDWALW